MIPIFAVHCRGDCRAFLYSVSWSRLPNKEMLIRGRQEKDVCRNYVLLVGNTHACIMREVKQGIELRMSIYANMDGEDDN